MSENEASSFLRRTPASAGASVTTRRPARTRSSGAMLDWTVPPGGFPRSVVRWLAARERLASPTRTWHGLRPGYPWRMIRRVLLMDVEHLVGPLSRRGRWVRRAV